MVLLSCYCTTAQPDHLHGRHGGRSRTCSHFSWGEGVLPSWRASYGQPPVVARPLPYPNCEHVRILHLTTFTGGVEGVALYKKSNLALVSPDRSIGAAEIEQLPETSAMPPDQRTGDRSVA